jgi:ubiquinone/menaquinone biosynthesis C-methylase UbiE
MAGTGDAGRPAPAYTLGMTTQDQSKPGLRARAFARIYDPFLALGERRGMTERRRALLAPLTGRVLELGAGTGLNLAHYPDGLDELVLTEPDPGMGAHLRRRVERSDREATVVAAPGEALPFPDDSFDAVVSTLVLCTVADPSATLREVRRVLRPGGRLRFIEHVRASSPALARWQDRLAKPWGAFASGCRCNQPTLELLDGELAVDEVSPVRWRGMPPIVAPVVVGQAQIR